MINLLPKNRQHILFGFFVLFFFSCEQEVQYESMISPSYTFLLGAYTSDASEGIGLLEFDAENRILHSHIIAAGISNPSFVIADKTHSLVFSVEENAGENGGKVNSYQFDRENKQLKLIDTQDSRGDGPCFLALDPKEEFLLVGNYSSGNFSVFKLTEGSMQWVQTIQHEGQSINPGRQGQAHVHSLVFHPDGKQLLVADLGTDKIHLYDFNPDYTVPFNHSEPAHFEVSAGAGPRHLAVHPSGAYVYLIHELSAEVGVYGFEKGNMRSIDQAPLTDREFIGSVGAAEIRISPDAKHLYASNRGDANDISVFEIRKDGLLKFVQRIKSGGDMPRNFILTKDGKYLLAAHQASDNITVFQRDQKTGELIPLELEAKFPSPVYFFGLD
jgi:6-phosphogluconolactonase